ncbi:MAG: hypothetical protein LBV72_15760 [Tannerella sp.]|jgi:hypothetical protein|nr:hypothetical protein [Tannerella sp.]
MHIENIQSSINEIFKLQESDESVFYNLSKELAEEQIKSLRTYLESFAKKCSVYEFLSEHFDCELNKTKATIKQGHCDNYAIERWIDILEIHKNINDLIGYLTLLQMDAIMTCISLFQATTDTERIMLCKHSYTIIYEALEHNLFKRTARDMRKYPIELVTKEEIDELWKSIKKDTKKITEKDEAKQVRNKIDAHKSDSFIEQINTYKQCKWSESIKNLCILITTIERLQNFVEKINTNTEKLYAEYKVMMEEHIKQYDNILKMLQNPDETCVNSK